MQLHLRGLKKRNEQATAFEKEHASFFERLIEGFETIFKERSSLITLDAQEPETILHTAMIEQVTSYLHL